MTSRQHEDSTPYDTTGGDAMPNFCCFTARLVAHRGELGATATEYGLMVGFVAMAILVGVGAFGFALNDLFDGFATWIGIVI